MKKKSSKKTVALFLAVSLLLGGVGVQEKEAQAAKAPKLSKKISVTVGKTKSLKLKFNKKKVAWKVISGKKNIVLKAKKKNGVKIVAKKVGTAKVQAEIGKKKLVCKVTIMTATASESPMYTNAPTTTMNPTSSKTPVSSMNPVVSNVPVNTIAPVVSNTPAGSATPEGSVAPQETAPAKTEAPVEKNR